MHNTDEAELIAQTKQGDHAAYAELINRYKNALYHHCFAITRDEDVAEDIAQDTFITAYYKLTLYNPQYRLSTWLFRIATNKALNHFKKTAQESRASDEAIESVVSTQPLPHQQAEHTELRQAITQLKPEYRAVISLYYWQGLKYSDIAQAMGAPEGSIKVWMKRAKEQLRKELS
jgi:RNA polymerase sigma-70 factor (ECF subfamily)